MMETLEETLAELPPVSELLSGDEYIDEIMVKASAPFRVKKLDRLPVHFFCRCSTDNFKNALALLSYEDLKGMQDEDQKMVRSEEHTSELQSHRHLVYRLLLVQKQ